MSGLVYYNLAIASKLGQGSRLCYLGGLDLLSMPCSHNDNTYPVSLIRLQQHDPACLAKHTLVACTWASLTPRQLTMFQRWQQ